jgi:hypothetical protein
MSSLGLEVIGVAFRLNIMAFVFSFEIWNPVLSAYLVILSIAF